MSWIECPLQSGRESTKEYKHVQVPMFDPGAILRYLFDEIALEIPTDKIQEYWVQAANAGCPWAQRELNESGLSDLRIPVKLFGDDCVYDERLTKAYGIYMSLPLWRPHSARNSRFLMWAQKSTQFAGFEGLLPLLGRMAWSLNQAYDHKLEKSGHRFCVTEIGGDWSWNRFFWQMDRHWNGLRPCPFCNVEKFGHQSYAKLNDICWIPNISFVNHIVGSGSTRRVNPLILLRNFDMSLVQPCQLHNLNLGLLWTSNGAAVATFGEMGFWGDPNLSLALIVENAWDDFRLFLKQERRHCSQCKFTIKMIFKQNHGAYFSAKGHNSRVLADWLADCAERAWGRNFDGSRIFGQWLQGHPQRLQAALHDQQLPHLCLALTPGLPCAVLVSTSSGIPELAEIIFCEIHAVVFLHDQPFDCQDFYRALYGFEWSLPSLPEPTQHIMGSEAPSINPKLELVYRRTPWYTNTGIYIGTLWSWCDWTDP